MTRFAIGATIVRPFTGGEGPRRNYAQGMINLGWVLTAITNVRSNSYTMTFRCQGVP